MKDSRGRTKVNSRGHFFLPFLMVIMGSVLFCACQRKTTIEEKTLVIYTQHPTEFVIPIVKEFEERYGIEVEVVQGGSGDLIAQIREQAEDQKADILWGGSIYTIKPSEDLFAEYQTINETEIQDEFKNVEGNLIRFTDVPSVLMVNTDLIGEKEIKGYEDLLDPELKGKIAFADPNRSSSSWEQLINMLYAFSETTEAEPADHDMRGGWEYVEKLLKQLDGNLLTSSSAVYNGVALGEYTVGLTFEEAAAGLQAKGKPVEIIYMKEGVVSTPDGVYLIKNAPHEQEAKQFLDFATSYDVQYMITRQLSRRSVRKDISSPPALEEKSNMHMLQTDAAFVLENREKWLNQFNELWEEVAGE